MLRIRFSHLLGRGLTILVIVTTLLPVAWAKPKFKVLANVSGGLFYGVTFDSTGNLFGVANGGGTYDGGTVFELTPHPDGKWTRTTIHDFDCQTEGCGPSGNLIFDAAGNIYGTAADSPSGSGMVYELTPGSAGWSLSVLFYFDGENGYRPSGLVMDATGNLYGVAGGGTYSRGVAYELAPGSGGWSEDVLYDFGGADGYGPAGALTLGRVGTLYGTTVFGGAYGGGVVFELKGGSGGAWRERLLYSFCPDEVYCVDGATPDDGVVLGPSGGLYGTTEAGGRNVCGEGRCGVAFELRRTGRGRWKETVLYNFRPGASGNFPSSGLVFDKAGNPYGTTGVGGIGGCPYGCGVVYRLAPGRKGKWKYTVLHQFDGADGSMPGGGLVLDRKGNLYGAAYSVVYEITP
jgi:hypothetical protein